MEEEMPLAVKTEHVLGGIAKFHLAFEPFTSVNTLSQSINQSGDRAAPPESMALSITATLH